MAMPGFEEFGHRSDQTNKQQTNSQGVLLPNHLFSKQETTPSFFPLQYNVCLKKESATISLHIHPKGAILIGTKTKLSKSKNTHSCMLSVQMCAG